MKASEYAKLNDVERCALIGELAERKFMKTARPAQIPGLGFEKTWVTHVSRMGRGGGKTHSGSGWLTPLMLKQPNRWAAILGPTFDHCEKVCLFGESGIIPRIPDESLWHWSDKKKKITFANGSVIQCFSSVHIRQMRGPQFHYWWIDEPADLSNDMECWEIGRPAIRLQQEDGTPSRTFITGTPAPTDLILHLDELHKEEPELYTMSTGSLMDNIENLDAMTAKELVDRYKGSRYYQQEIEGMLLMEAEGALWSHATLEACQDKRTASQIDFDEVIMVLDPAVSEEKKADETGLIALGRIQDEAYVIGDYSLKESPLKYARKLVDVSYDHNARVWVMEDNLAGPLIKGVLQGALNERHSQIRIKTVHARGSKAARAEPVAALYEAGKVHHLAQDPGVPDLRKLEKQMTTWDPTKKKSPDRIDAIVHGITYLLLRNKAGTLHVPRSGSSSRTNGPQIRW